MTLNSTDRPLTFDAQITVVYASHGHRTIVSVPGDDSVSSVLPLTDVAVTLRPGEVFMAAGANGQSAYFTDLGPAVAFTRHTGSAGTPGAIVVLTPCVKVDGITGFNVAQVHERAEAAPDQSS